MRPTALIAAFAALALVAAANPAPPAHGTAETKMSALEVSVTGLPTPGEVNLLDVVSFASTDTNEDRNPHGVPYSIITAVPAVIAGETVGAISASSDGDNEATSQGLSQTVGPLAATVGALDLRATADETRALAVLDAVNAQVDALSGALDIGVNDVGLSSDVTREAASAVQGVKFDGVNIQLGDLLPLEDLPLDVVIGLAQQLTGLLTGTIVDVLDQVLALYGQLGQQIQSVRELRLSYATTSAELTATLEEIEETEDELAAITAKLAEAEALLDTGGTEEQITKIVEEGSDLIEDVTGVDLDDGDELVSLQVSPQDALSDLIADLEETKGTLEGELAELQEELEDLVDDVVQTLAELVDLTEVIDDTVNDLVSAIEDLLAQLPSILDALEDADLVDIGAMDVGISATASGSDAQAVLGCAAESVRVVGADLGSPSCGAPLTEASAALNEAIGTLKGVLGELPVVGGVIPDITLEVFSNAREETGEADGYRFAEAGVDLLEFELPSIDLGDLTDGLLDGLLDGDLSDLLDELGGTLGADLSGALGGVDAELDAALEEALSGVTSVVSEIIDVETVLGDVLATLPTGDALAGLSTPGIAIKIDPTSRAEFRTGAVSTPGGPGGPGDGSPSGAPSLPTTGGGLGVLGLLAVVGAVALRRRT